MQWTDELSVGVEIIDTQHKELFLRINDLVAAIRQSACKYKIGDVVKFLGEYITFHFSEEEKLMKQCGYPALKQHREHHKKFIANFKRIKARIPELEGGAKPGSYDLSMETNQIIVDWILDHIARVDKAFGEFLKDRPA